jgi:hypothetical protein
MYREFLRFLVSCVIEIVAIVLIVAMIFALAIGLSSAANGDVAPRKSCFSSRPDKVHPAPDRIRFIHSEPLYPRTLEIRTTVSMLIRRGEWRGVDVTIYNTSHFYWQPSDDFDCPYILVNAVMTPRGFYEIDSIEDYSGDKIKPISLRKPEDEKEAFFE